MLLLPASRLARQGNFSILQFVVRVSNRRFSTRSREQLSVTTSHEARSAALRLGDSPARWATSLSYPSPSACQIGRPRRLQRLRTALFDSFEEWEPPS